MKLLRRILGDFKANPRAFWFALVAIGLSIFFFADLACYYGLGDDYTLSAAMGEALGVDQSEFYHILGAWLMGVWFAHFFGFGAKPRRQNSSS